MSDQNRPLLRLRTQAQAESGFTLIEALVALFLLAMIMSGVVTAAGTFHGATSLNRTRQIGTQIANNAVEQARALSFNDLKLKPGTGAPPTYADPDCTAAAGNSTPGTCNQTPDATIVMGAANCGSCIPYTYTTSQRGLTYTVTQMVLKLGSFTDNQGQTQTLKKLIVTVSWNQPKAGSTQVATILNNQDYLNPVTPTGVHVEIHDDGCVDDPANPGTPIAGSCNTPPGAVIGDDDLYWKVTIKDINGNVVTGIPTTTTEGLLDATLPVGTYYCTVTNSGLGGTPGYFQMNSAGAVTSFGCNGATLAANNTLGEVFSVVQGDTTNLVSQWTYSSTCKTSNTNGQLQLSVMDNSDPPKAINGATIVLVNSTGSKTFNFKTDADGTITTSNMPADQYTVTVNASNYTVSASTVCVYAGTVFAPPVFQLGTAPAANGNLNVSIKNASTTKSAQYQISALGASAQTGLIQQSITVGATKTTNPPALFGNIPVDTYTVKVCRVVDANNCQPVNWPAPNGTDTATAVINNGTNLTLSITDPGG